MAKKPIIITMGEPAGIGPDIIAKISAYKFKHPLVVLGDKNLLLQRAKILNIHSEWLDYQGQDLENNFYVWHHPLPVPINPGKPNSKNAAWILELLKKGAESCFKSTMHALVTAPVNKAIIQKAGFTFSGHTEFLADFFSAQKVLMLFVTKELKVALLTTHIPLHSIPQFITEQNLFASIQLLHKSLQNQFGIPKPSILVCGLNPHAGEDGCIGDEEIKIIRPALQKLCAQGIQVQGPFAADTIFIKQNTLKADAILALYHDQGLAPLKAMYFDEAVNVTLGLPIVRTSVDHGTAFELAGTGNANEKNLLAAIKLAETLHV